jgi:hypothetical protein
MRLNFFSEVFTLSITFIWTTWAGFEFGDTTAASMYCSKEDTHLLSLVLDVVFCVGLYANLRGSDGVIAG